MTHDPQRTVDDRLADWVDGRMTPRERERFTAELRVNPQLRQDLEGYERTVAAVRAALQAPIVPTTIADRVLRKIAAAEVAPAPRTVRPRWSSLVWGLSAAAALLAVAVWLNSGGPAAPTGRLDAALVVEVPPQKPGEAPAEALSKALDQAAAPATPVTPEGGLWQDDEPGAAGEAPMRKAAANEAGQIGESPGQGAVAPVQTPERTGAPVPRAAAAEQQQPEAGAGAAGEKGTAPSAGDGSGVPSTVPGAVAKAPAEERKDEAAPASSPDSWGALAGKATPPPAGPTTGGPATAGPAGPGTAPGSPTAPAGAAGGGPGGARVADGSPERLVAGVPVPDAPRDKVAADDAAKGSRFGAPRGGPLGRGRGAPPPAMPAASASPPLPMVVVTSPTPLTPLTRSVDAGSRGDSKAKSGGDAPLDAFFVAQLGGNAAPERSKADAESPAAKERRQDRSGEAANLAGLFVGWSEVASAAQVAESAPAGEPRFVERTWLVEGSREHVASVLKALGDFARRSGCELTNGEFPGAALPAHPPGDGDELQRSDRPAAKAPSAAAPSPAPAAAPPIRVVVRFRVRA
jgi:hypothetical protein